MASSSDMAAPRLWLHSCHGSDAESLTLALVNRVAPGTVAENFVREADTSANMLGLECRLEETETERALVVDQAQPLVVAAISFAEVSFASLPSNDFADMIVVSIVPPLTDHLGQGLGLRGAELGSQEGAAAGWFVILQGGGDSHLNFLDRLSRMGCLRKDLEQNFLIAQNPDLIGEGAYASVFKEWARDQTLVAVKQMNYVKMEDYDSVEREVQYLVQLQGKNIVGFRGLFWRMELDQVRFSAVFDLAPRGDLLCKILQRGVVKETTARPLFVGILKGLKHIHDAGIVHRDIKTENILLGDDDEPMVGDFGLACLLTDSQQMKRRCGSAGFVAPEVCLGTPYDCKVDNFGAGVILYFMLSKDTPFSSPDQDSAATMWKTVKCSLHLHRPPWDGMTSRMRNILRQLICKSQQERLTAADALEHSWITGRATKSSSTSSKTKKAVEADGQPGTEAADSAQADGQAGTEPPAPPPPAPGTSFDAAQYAANAGYPAPPPPMPPPPPA